MDESVAAVHGKVNLLSPAMQQKQVTPTQVCERCAFVELEQYLLGAREMGSAKPVTAWNGASRQFMHQGDKAHAIQTMLRAAALRSKRHANQLAGAPNSLLHGQLPG